MKNKFFVIIAGVVFVAASLTGGAFGADAQLPSGVKAVWDLGKANREKTSTRERVCLNGLWRWQPAKVVSDPVPKENWGYFKVPGSWPGITDYMHKDSQRVFFHPTWKDENLAQLNAAWYQREIAIPAEWAGGRIILYSEYLNSFAVIYVDGKKVGEIRFPAGEVDLTPVCRPGGKHVLSMLVIAMPLKGVMLSYNDTASAREVKGGVARRGLCGDVFLSGEPSGERISEVKVDTSVRKGEITVHAAVHNIREGGRYSLRARIMENGRVAKEFTGVFKAADRKINRISFSEKWIPERLWDIHTPQNLFQAQVSLLNDSDQVLDTYHDVRFGFRELWIEGRDFYLNGTRIFLSSVPLDSAQAGAVLANYEGAKESMLRLKSFGINFVYTHNYGCEPGSHLSFTEILKAADDVGMLVALSQPHLGHYDWGRADAEQTNGYAPHAAFYARVAGSHPSVVMYATSHNATGYSEDMNPDLIDGVYDRRDKWSADNARKALRAEAIIRSLDPSRIVYHHSSGNFGPMHTTNFYPNFVPVQEMSDWFGHWATKGVKPLFTCEYATPFPWDWAMYRGWYKGQRSFGGANVPWEFCLAEWNAQFLGDPAFQVSENDKKNMRWEAGQFRAGKLWKRWDYPYPLDSRELEERYPVFALYINDNWRAFRTWGVSANSPWEYGHYWKLREGVKRNERRELPVDWENLQKPGFSPDYVEQRYERMDMAYDLSAWIATPAAQALIRNNLPVLAYIGGKSSHFTGKDHNFFPGEKIEKQIIVINNSREAVIASCEWKFALPQPVTGSKKVSIKTGEQDRIPLSFDLPPSLAPGTYTLELKVKFSKGGEQKDSLIIHVLPHIPTPKGIGRAALFDPKGETGQLLKRMGIGFQPVDANADLSAFDVLFVGKAALTTGGRAPDIRRVREGLKVVIFEQTSEVLERRFGFRVQEYGLRNGFKRVPDHPLLSGIDADFLRDWRGEATILSSRLEYEPSVQFYGVPAVRWCDIEVTRAWRCGNYGNIASVLIEKPARGDFLPIVDGGFSLQYSPLMEYREGKGMILFCQMDVTGRTESDPAAERITRNIFDYLSVWKPAQRRKAFYAGNAAGKSHLLRAGIPLGSYEGGALNSDEVLIVGPGSGKKLNEYSARIGVWIKSGGHILLIGADEGEANAFLPIRIRVRKQEYISSYFGAPAGESLLAGVGPADVHNRDPRELMLIEKGGLPVGAGVLATGHNANVVFCQLVPWEFDYQKQFNVKRTFRRTSFTLARLLANMGVSDSTPIIARFHHPVRGQGEKRWLEGLYLDKPEEWDDPYRFFRW